MNVLTLCAIPVLLLFSAFFSMSEMAFSSANQMRLERAAEQNTPGARLALRILTHFDDTLSAVLVGNNLVNIATSSFGSMLAIAWWGEQWTWVMTLLLTIVVIIFGETMPKIIAKKNANRLVLVLCYPIRLLSLLLKPVTIIVVFLVSLVMKALPTPSQHRDEEEAQQELQSIIETAENEKVLDEDQSELMQAALEFDDTTVGEIMTARVDMEAIDADDPWEDILAFIDRSTFSRLPVYRESVDHIIGILSQNRLYRRLTTGEEISLPALLDEPVYLFKTTKLPTALHSLRAQGQHMGLVVDEYGGVMGIITREDIMEQLIGDIWDEKDEPEPEDVIEQAEGVYEVDGGMLLSDFAELMDWKEEELDAESMTVGGLTAELNGAFPQIGDCFVFRNAKIHVLSMDGLRVERLLITRMDETPMDEDTP